jgi:phosphoglycolate phosphatase-like HAD superfamily hydrolase
MKYKCLVLDHDDTAVKSTPDIHYPSFVKALKSLRPEIELSLNDFVNYCFSPGFTGLCRDILKFNDREQEIQYKIWKYYLYENAPDFYPGFPELIKGYKRAGGIICVVSHSESSHIIRDYTSHCGFEPDLIFGWELDEDKRKPNPYAIVETMKTYDLSNREILVVDDSKPGLMMARSCNVDFAAAGWSHALPRIENYMRMNSDYYFSTVDEFSEFIFDGGRTV